MRKWNRFGFVAAILLSLSPVAAVQANMPPPEPFVLGVAVADDADGLRITAVVPGSHAESLLKPGDIIVGVDGHWVKGMSADGKKNAIEGRHMWKTELVVVRDRRDIVSILVRA